MDALHMLSIAGLMIGALDYALLVRRRARKRRLLESAHLTGLQGLVRVMLADA